MKPNRPQANMVNPDNLDPNEARAGPSRFNSRSDESVSINIRAITSVLPAFNVNSHSVNSTVKYKGKEVSDETVQTSVAHCELAANRMRPTDRRGVNVAQEELDTLHSTLTSLLECPVCMEPIAPPIHQCRRGHLVLLKQFRKS